MIYDPTLRTTLIITDISLVRIKSGPYHIYISYRADAMSYPTGQGPAQWAHPRFPTTVLVKQKARSRYPKIPDIKPWVVWTRACSAPASADVPPATGEGQGNQPKLFLGKLWVYIVNIRFYCLNLPPIPSGTFHWFVAQPNTELPNCNGRSGSQKITAASSAAARVPLGHSFPSLGESPVARNGAPWLAAGYFASSESSSPVSSWSSQHQG